MLIQPERFINRLSSARQASPLRALYYMPKSPTAVDFTAGVPNPSCFVFQEAEFKYRDNSGSCSLDETLMTEAQQYTNSIGIPPLKAQLREIQERIHCPVYDGWDLCVTLGSQDAICKAFEMILEIGDYVIIQEPAYPGTINIIHPYSPRYITVEGDEHGMKPSSLRQSLEARWSTPDLARNANTDFPKVLYCSPVGSNPTGVNWSEDRKREIYKIAQEYDFLIIEDDPYYFLNFESEEMPRSFLSLDTDGRVIRCDSFSKVLSAGIRVGFCTAHPAFIDRIVKHMEVTAQHAPAICQIMVCETLKKWQYDGFIERTKVIKKFYSSLRDLMVAAAEKYLTGLAEWHVPQGGFFLWIKVRNLEDTHEMMLKRTNINNVRLVPGKVCTLRNEPSPYLRASFSMVTASSVEKGMMNLADMIREELDERKSKVNGSATD